MRKIPTIYVRDPDTNNRHVKNEVVPGCEWVLGGEGVPTRKYDGTCVMWDGMAWWARREVKPGKAEPANFRVSQYDENTGKTVGWEPADASGFVKFLREAEETWGENPPEGTYELIGPKINGNPEGVDRHKLILHADAAVLDDTDRTFDALGDWLLAHDYEGIVWHHPDGRMAKLKKRDFA
jgi:hypothetical protein